MTRAVAVLRPEPGNARTADRLAASGLAVIRLPLFVVEPREWAVSPAARYDALIVTSANAVRHAGSGLASVAHLPAFAVGQATADAMMAAGLTVAGVGDRDAYAALALARGNRAKRPLHLAGADRVALATIDTVTVYASRPVPVDDGAILALADQVALLHSARAAVIFAEHVDRAALPRAAVRLAALSPAVAAAAGEGWAAVIAADRPTDAALVALARRLAD